MILINNIKKIILLKIILNAIKKMNWFYRNNFRFFIPKHNSKLIKNKYNNSEIKTFLILAKKKKYYK